MLNAWQPLLQIADLLLTHVFEAYFHRTVRSSIAFIIGSILERSRVRYYHPALIGGLMTRALHTTPQCSNISKEEHTASNIPKPGPASTIPTLRIPASTIPILRIPAPTIPALQTLAPAHHHIPSCQEVYITHQRTSGRGPGLVCAAANQKTGFHENSLRQKVNQVYKALQRSTEERQHKYSSHRQAFLMTWALWLVSWITVSHITWECLLKNTCAI